MSTVYDTGVLIAADRNDRTVWADHRARLELGLVPTTTAPAVAQASRSPKQAQLRRFLRGCNVVPFASDQAHDVGSLLAAARTDDIVDAHVIITATQHGPVVITSDARDLEALAIHIRPRLTIQPLSD